MAKFKTEELLQTLKCDVQRIAEAAEYLRSADPRKLIYQTDKEKWSVVQVLEHVNFFSRHYLPLIEKELSTEAPAAREAWFNSGYWGEKFTKMMKPTNVYEIKNKMKSPKASEFPNSLNVETVLAEFLEHANTYQRLLDEAARHNLGAIHIPVKISRFIKLRLGDALRFLVAHMQRHMVQARNTLKATGVATDKFPVILEAAPR